MYCMKPIVSFVVFCLLSTIAIAQNPQEYKAKYYVDPESGKLYWQAGLPLYLFVSDQADGQNLHRLESEETKPFANPMYLDTEGVNYIRSRWAVDKTTMETVQPEREVMFEIYRDGNAPLVQVRFENAPKFAANNVIYFGKGLQLNRTISDELSGVEGVFYTMNKGVFAPYTDVVQVDAEGEHTFDCYAVDKVGNVSEVYSKSFVVDHSAPTTFHTVVGIAKDSIISSTTKIYLEPEDNLSGVANTYYRLDEGREIKYDGKVIDISKLEDGDHVLYYYSVDEVQNKEVEKRFPFYLDKTAPIVASDILGDRYISDGKVYF